MNMSNPNFGFETKQENIYKTLVDNLVIDPKKYNIRWDMPSTSDLQKMVNSIKSIGQQQPIICGVLDGKMTVVVGFCRALAFKDLNRQQRSENIPETPIKFSVADKKKIADELFRAENNVDENECRFHLSPMDKAYAMRTFYDKFKWDQGKIADKYGISQASVSNYLKLFELSETIQKDIHEGTVTFSQALLLFKVPKEKRDEVVKDCKASPNGSSKLDNVPTGSGKNEGKPRVNTGELKKSAEKIAKTTYARSISDFKALIVRVNPEEPILPESSTKILDALFDWFTGTKDDKRFLDILESNSIE